MLPSHPMHKSILGYLWASPNTALGLVCVALTLLTRGRARIVDGVVEARGGLARLYLRSLPIGRGGASALTLGHVILGQDERCLDRSREHERVHVAQYARYGPFFLPVYGLASLYCLCTGRRPYRDNFLEREAYRVAPMDGSGVSHAR